MLQLLDDGRMPQQPDAGTTATADDGQCFRRYFGSIFLMLTAILPTAAAEAGDSGRLPHLMPQITIYDLLIGPFLMLVFVPQRLPQGAYRFDDTARYNMLTTWPLLRHIMGRIAGLFFAMPGYFPRPGAPLYR